MSRQTPCGVASASLTERLAQRLCAPVTAIDRARAALLLIDWLGCALGALRSDLGVTLRGLADEGEAGRCSALGVGRRRLEEALALNAALGNVLEMDDLHREAILHPGPIVIPTALALAQQRGNDAHALLDAIVRGYEASIRIGRSLGREHYRFWHPTSTAGTFGAAATAGSLLQLSADALADALGTAGSSAGGLWQMRHEPVPTKSLHNAEAARRGVVAATLAARGLRGPRRILEGEQGLFAATAGDAQPSQVIDDDPAWLIHSTSLKPWPACRHVHPCIDAMRAVWSATAGEASAADAIERIEISTYEEAIRFCNRPQPSTELEAKFSLQHAAAAIVVLGDPALSHYLPEALRSAGLAALRDRVTVIEDPALSAAFPQHYGASVRVVWRDGRSLLRSVSDAWGDPEQPMDIAAVHAKMQRLAQWGGVDRLLAQRLIELAQGLVGGESLAALGGALADLRVEEAR